MMHGTAPPSSSALLAAFSSSNHWLTIDLPRVRLDKPRTNLLRATQAFKSSLYVYFCSPVFGPGRCPTEVRRRVEQKVAKGTKVAADLSSQRYAGCASPATGQSRASEFDFFVAFVFFCSEILGILLFRHK
jgi:hypothetical protein